jgi:choice-of-anchor B domain-containing protein
VALIVLSIGGAIAITAGAADPSEGTISTDQAMTGWNGQHYASSLTPVPEDRTAEAVCAPPNDDLCDHFDLTVDVDPSHWDSNTGGAEIVISWESEEDDFDLYVYQGPGNTVGSSVTSGGTSERVFIENASGEYQVRVVPWDVVDSNYLGGARLESRAKIDNGPVPEEPVSNLDCVDGFAGPFPCDGVDLEGFLPNSTIGGGNLNDIWGWTDPKTGREYAIVGRTGGTAFVDISQPTEPKYLGNLPSHQSAGGQPVETIFNVWGDMKVYKNHAFIVREEPSHGMQVFDLTRLRDVDEEQEFTEDAHYSYTRDGIASWLDGVNPEKLLNPPDNAHNLAINEESGFAYAIGTSTCFGGGPHMVDISEPKNPTFAGCVSEDGYTHDTQCVNYREGDPDPEFAGREICFNSNEDTLTIVDVTDKENPEQLARVPYDDASYTHQGWLTEDRRVFLVDDELDEQEGGKEKTQTYVFNVEDLRNPTFKAAHAGEAESIDHNQYVVGDRTFQANYRSGLRILDISDAEDGTLEETGFFDVYPPDDVAEFNGAWSNYPYFASGIVIVSGIEQGLFVLRPQASAVPGPPTSGPGVVGPLQARAAKPRVVKRRVRVSKKGRARVVVKCPAQKPLGSRTIVNENARCVGHIIIRTGGDRIARKRFKIGAGERRVVRAKVRRRALASNAGNKRRAKIRVRGKRADGRRARRTDRVVLRFAKT